MNRADTEAAYIWFIKQDVIVYIMLQLEQDPGEDNQLIKHHCEAKPIHPSADNASKRQWCRVLQSYTKAIYYHH